MNNLLFRLSNYMKPKILASYELIKNTTHVWWSKDPLRESAVIAYYSIFSLPGLLVLIVSLAGYFFGREAVTGRLASEFSKTMGVSTALQIQDMVAKASQMKNTLTASIIGVVTIVIGATGVFVQLQESLNRVWEVKSDQTKSGWWTMIRIRLFSFGLIITIAFILMVSLVVSSLLSALNTWLSGRFPEFLLIGVQVLNFALSFGIITLLFAMMFKFLPDARIKWRHVWIGSMLTAFLFGIGKFGLGFYFGETNPGEGYGAAGSVVLILLWVSYSSLIVLFGAEFTRSFANLMDGVIAPEAHASTDKTAIETTSSTSD